jgi:hypothetical protein
VPHAAPVRIDVRRVLGPDLPDQRATLSRVTLIPCGKITDDQPR